jgi:hypothetical protein
MKDWEERFNEFEKTDFGYKVVEMTDAKLETKESEGE